MSDIDHTAPEGTPAPNPTSKMARRRARELALQGVYQWLLAGNSMSSVQKHLESESENLDKLDRELFGRVADQIPAGVIRVAESAVIGVDDARRYREAGADVILVGEALVTGDPVQTLQSFVNV